MATPPTGRPIGRPPGAKNKRTLEREKAVATVAAAIQGVIPGAFEGDAHAFLMALYKDPGQSIELRLEAAKAAIRYEKPALAAVQLSGELAVTYDVSDEPLTEEQWAAQYAATTETEH